MPTTYKFLNDFTCCLPSFAGDYFPFIQFPWGIHASDRSKKLSRNFCGFPDQVEHNVRDGCFFVLFCFPQEGMNTHPSSTVIISCARKREKEKQETCIYLFIYFSFCQGLELVPRDFFSRLKN